MQPTKPWSLLGVAVITAVAAWIVVSATFADLPPLPWTAVPALGLLAVAELLVGRNLRARLRGRPGPRPVQPMAVPRIVALAKASSLAAAVFCGVAAGFEIYSLGSLDKPVPRHDAIAAGLTIAAAVALTAAALYLERSCRAPKPPEDEDQRPSAGGRAGHDRGGQRR